MNYYHQIVKTEENHVMNREIVFKKPLIIYSAGRLVIYMKKLTLIHRINLEW